MSAFYDAGLINGMRQHFVGVSVQYYEVDGAGARVSDDKIAVYSAFVIQIRGVWCLVTAGHVISDPKKGIEAILNHPKVVVRRIALADFFNPYAVTTKPTPFTYHEHHKIYIDQDGLDICIIPLHNFYRVSLEANGIVPLPCVHWDHVVPACEAYALIGLPTEKVRQLQATHTGAVGVSAQLVLAPVQPRPVPDDRVLSKIPRLAADLLDGRDLKSVEGMSGGPIIGIRKSEAKNWEYACIAVQSAWHEPTRVIFGTPVGMVVRVIEDELDKNAAEKKR